MAVTNFKASHATIKFSTSAVTFDTSTNLDDETYATTVVAAKNITITRPKREVEQVALLGTSTITIGAGNPRTGIFQNAFMDEKNASNAKFSGTLVLTGDEVFEALATGSGTAIAGTNASTRYSYGDSTATTGARPTVGAIMITLHNNATDSSGEVFSCVFSNVYVNFGDLKVTGSDGHFEIDVEGECLPEGYADECQD
ncbi:hypothetical protein HYU06_05805 [Candidatus Woesearchaeota archaeon]|nr:hypothetical protein [Candidatus Woesearchaeota archaeon]